MNISRKNARRFTSLAALGVGTIALSEGEAKGDIVYVDLSSNPGQVGFDAGFGTSFNIPLPHGAGIAFLTGGTASGRSVYVRGHGGAIFAAFYSTLALFKKGAIGSGTSSSLHAAKSALIAFLGNGGYTYGAGAFSREYALFAFPLNSQLDFGWIELSDFVSSTSGPDLTILGYAYDTSGNPLPAGEVPEPSTLALSGLGALALGAAGVLRWRAARKKAESNRPAA